jgi:hypothetical protein
MILKIENIQKIEGKKIHKPINMNKGKINELMQSDTNDNYILISKELINTIEMSANAKLQNNSNRPLSEASIEARAILQLTHHIKDNNIYDNKKS